MSKTSLSWEQILDFISSLHYLGRIYYQHLNKLSSWLLCLLGLVFIWIWNWKLLLATLAGVGFMILVYYLQSKSWLAYWQRWQRFFLHSNRQLIVAVSSGSVTALGIYIAACIWTESENPWLATGIIVQTLASLITLTLLAWHFVGSNHLRQDEAEYNRLLTDLTHQDNLRKIIAIRQLTRLAKNSNLSPEYNTQLVEYYCLMLAQVRERALKEALLDSLESFGIEKILDQQNRPLQIPINFQPSPQPMYRNH